MGERKIVNARVRSTMLGKEDHGIPTCMLHLEWEYAGQGFGGHDLRFKSYGIAYIVKILETLGVETWEKLPGTFCRIEQEHSKIHRIGHIIENRWFEPEKDLAP